MDFLLPLLLAISSSAGLTLDKFNFKHTRISVRALLLCELSVMVLVVAMYVAVIPAVSFPISVAGLSVLLAIVGLSFAQNICEAKGLQLLNMNIRQPIVGLEPVLAASLAYVLFPSERHIRTLVAIVAGIFLVAWATGEAAPGYNLRVLGNRYAIADAAISAGIDMLLKAGVAIYSPALVPFVRISGVLILSLLFFRPSRETISSDQLVLSSLAGLALGIAAVASALSVHRFGLDFTILVILLQPCIVYLLSYAALREQFRWRPLVATVGVVLLAALAL